ncbi:MAG: ABC transporter permease [Clostridia bacterium]|nr:ABC transporter permease [Clostridia bacterium]MBT7123383.1 ABC transporter permease [Clostridia bacterium]
MNKKIEKQGSVSQNIAHEKQSGKILDITSRFGVYGILIVLIIAGIFINSNFFSLNNFKNVIQAGAFLGILCAGMAFITYSGHFADMSAPITMALSGIVTISCISFGIVPALLIGIGAGVLVGVINGIVIGKFKANPIIWTLAMNFVVSGIIRWVYSNKQIYPDVESGGSIAGEMFTNISRTYLWGIPISVFIMIGLLLIGQFVLSKTRYGKQLKIIGSNIDTAKLTGINVSRNILIAYIIASFAAALAGIFVTSFGKVGAYYNGEGYDFRAVTAIVIGGMTLSGGRGNMIGVLGGVLTIGILSNLMTFIGIGTFEQQIVTGAIFILIVWINSNSLRKLGRDDA